MEKDRVEKNREWTFNPPTKEGFYWIEEGINQFTIVRVRRSLFDKNNLAVTFFESGDHVDPARMKGTKWSGPISPPSTGRIKEEEYLP